MGIIERVKALEPLQSKERRLGCQSKNPVEDVMHESNVQTQRSSSFSRSLRLSQSYFVCVVHILVSRFHPMESFIAMIRYSSSSSSTV